MASWQYTLAKLPLRFNFSGYQLQVERFRPEQISEGYKLVCAEASLGKDVGQDEFPSEAHLFHEIRHAYSFSVSDSNTGAMRAFIMLSPSDYSRMLDPPLADGVIICDITIKDMVIQSLIQVAIELASDLGYESVFANVFSSSDLVVRLREEGFMVIGCIPNSGHLRGKGWTDCLVMFKDIKSYRNPQMPARNIRDATRSSKIRLQPVCGHNNSGTRGSHNRGDFVHPDFSGLGRSARSRFRMKPNYVLARDERSTAVPNDEQQGDTGIDNMEVDDKGDGKHKQATSSLRYLNQKPHNPYLPRSHTFQSGERITLRYLEEGDLPAVYNMYREAAVRGDGYSTDEFSTFDIFRCDVIDHGQPVVGEDVATSRIVLAASVVPCILCRTVDPLLADPYLVIDHNFQGKGIGQEVSTVILKFIQELGYTGVLADCLADNVSIVKIMRKTGFAVVGYIPKAAKGKDQKLSDTLLFYKDLASFDSKL